MPEQCLRVSCTNCFPCTGTDNSLALVLCVNHHRLCSQNCDRENVAVVVGRPFKGFFNELWLWLRTTRCIPTIKGCSPLGFIELMAISKDFFHVGDSSIDQQVPTCQSWTDVNEWRWVCNIYKFWFDLTLCSWGAHSNSFITKLESMHEPTLLISVAAYFQLMNELYVM